MRLRVQLAALLACLTVLNSSVRAEEGTRASLRCTETRGHHDGDTFACVPSEEGAEPFVVRFASIDAPETGQAFWRTSRSRLRELAGPGAQLDCYKTDRYARAVCRVRTPDGDDAAAIMIREGLAWYAVSYAREDSPQARLLYASLEAEARQAHRGIWTGVDPMPPWDCRRARRQRQRCR